ncbi:MAG: PEP-CTERM sorting domain-containing protein [Verrucomicrobiota bacterium]
MKKLITMMAVACVAAPAMAALVDDIYVARDSGLVRQMRQSGGGITTVASHAGDGSSATAITTQSDGDVIYTTANGTIYRLNQDCVFQQNQGGFGSLASVAVLSDGSVIAGNTGGVVYKRTSTLGFAGSFSGNGTMSDLAVQSDDDIIAVSKTGYIYRLDSGLTTQASRTGMGDLLSVAVQGDDKTVFGRTSGLMRRVNADTLADLNSNSLGLFDSLAVFSDDKIVAIRDNQVVVYNADLTVDGSSYNAGFGDLTAVAVNSEDNIVMGNAAGQLWVINRDTFAGESYVSGLGNITDITISSIPEPATLSLVGLLGGGLLWLRKRFMI